MLGEYSAVEVEYKKTLCFLSIKACHYEKL